MIEKLSTLRVRKELGEILNRVALRHDEFIIERKGKALAAVIPVEKFRQIDRLARSFLRDLLARERPGISQEEAERLANEAKHSSRKKGRR